MAEECSEPGSSVLHRSEKKMVRSCVLAARNTAILDWVFLAIVVLVLGFGVSNATPQIKIDRLETAHIASHSP